MTEGTYLITGATGKTGRRVVRMLTERGLRVRSASRRGDTRFDWDDAATWGPALEDVTAVYLVHAELGSVRSAEQVSAFARVAAESGVRRAVLVSQASPDETDGSPVATAERALAATRIDLTVLRPRWFFQNFSEDFLYDAVAARELRVPAGTGADGFVDAEDIAAVGVAALTEDGHAGRDYDITGPELLTFADVAAELSRATGQTIVYTELTNEQYVQEQVAAGVPVEFARTIASAYDQLARGRLQFLTRDVETVTGRSPIAFADYARSAVEQNVWPTLS